MRRMIDNLDEFKRADGNPEYQVVEDSSVMETDSYSKRYSKYAITPNTISFVVDVVVKPGKKITGFSSITNFKIPDYIIEHLGANDTIGTDYIPVFDKSTRAVMSNVTAFLVNLQPTDKNYVLMLANDIDNTAGTTELEFRTEFTFIL